MRGIGATLTVLTVLGAALLGAAFALAKGPGMAGGLVFKFGPDLAASNWQYVRFPRRADAKFQAQGEDTIVVQAKAGVGLLWHSVPPWGSDANRARWRWRVMQGVGPTDLTKKGGDDRALAIYFAFADDEEDISETTNLVDLLRRQRGDVLVYVWGGIDRPGSFLPLPYFGQRGVTVVKRAADAPQGTWFSEAADLHDDFRRAFGRAPGKLVAVAVSSDSDDTGDLNLAAVADFCIN